MKKLKYTKKFETIAKINCVLGSVFILLAMIVAFLLEMGKPVPIVWFFIPFSLGCISALIIIVYPYIFDEPDEDFVSEIKPDKFSVTTSSFNEFFEKAEMSLETNGLTKIATQKQESYEFYLYATPPKTKIDFVLIINAEEVTKEILNDSVNACQAAVNLYCNKKKFKLFLEKNIITVVCVKRMTAALRTVLNRNAGHEQDFAISRFISAISFGGRNLYTIKQKGLVGKGKYKKCKSQFEQYFSFINPSEVVYEVTKRYNKKH